MKRSISALLLVGTAAPTMYASKWDTATRALYLATKEPEKALSFIGFLIDLFLMCIPVAIIAGIVSLILRSVFDLDKDDTAKSFCVIGGILLAICLLIYFLV